MIEDLLLDFDLPNMLADMSNDEFERWLCLGKSLSVAILLQCLESTRKDLEVVEDYEKCILLNKFIKTL